MINKEKKSAYRKKYYLEHKEQEKKYYRDHEEYYKTWREEHNAEQKEYFRKYHRDGRRKKNEEYQKKYAWEHKTEKKEYSRKYNQEHKPWRTERKKNYSKKWQQDNPEKVREYHTKRRDMRWVLILPNIFPDEIPIDYHHVDGYAFVAPLPTMIHKSVSGRNKKLHLERANDWVEFYYGIHPSVILSGNPFIQHP